MEDGRVYRPSQRPPQFVRALALGEQLPEYFWGDPLLHDHFQYVCSEYSNSSFNSDGTNTASNSQNDQEFEDCVLLSQTRLVRLINHSVHDIVHLSEVVSVDHFSNRTGSVTCYYLLCDLLRGTPMQIQVCSNPAAKFLVGVIQLIIKRNMTQMGLGVQSMIYHMLPKAGEKLEDVLKPLDMAWHMIGCVPAFHLRSRQVGGAHKLQRTEAARTLDQREERRASQPPPEDQSFEEFILSELETLIKARVSDLLLSDTERFGAGFNVVEEKRSMQLLISQVDEVILAAQKLVSPLESKELKERIILIFHQFLRPRIKAMSESIILADSIACIKWLPRYESGVRAYLVTEMTALDFGREMETRVGGLLEVFHGNSREKFQTLMNGVLEHEKKGELPSKRLDKNPFPHSDSPHDLFELVVHGSFNHATKAGINGRALLRHAETLCMILQSYQRTLALEYRSPRWVKDSSASLSEIMSKNVKISTSGGTRTIQWAFAQLNNSKSYLTHTDDFQSSCEATIQLGEGENVNSYLEECFETVREGFENLAYDALQMLVCVCSEGAHFILTSCVFQTEKLWKKKTSEAEKIKIAIESLEAMMDTLMHGIESLSHKEILALRFLPALTGHYCALFVEHVTHPDKAEIQVLRAHTSALQSAFETWCGDLVQENVVANRFQDISLLIELLEVSNDKLAEVVSRASTRFAENPILGPVLSDFLTKVVSHRKGGSGNVLLPASVNYSDTQEKLIVSVIKGTSLAAMDDNGLSDPFCQVMLTHPSLGVTTTLASRKTKTKFKTVNPVWNERIEFEGGVVIRGKTLVFAVWDYDYLKSPDLIGEAELNLDDIRDKGSRVMTLQLRPPAANRGRKKKSIKAVIEDKRPTTTIHGTIRRRSQEPPPPPPFRPAPSSSISSSGSGLGSIEVLANFVRVPQTEGLLVTVQEARGLKSVDKKGTSDPLCKVEALGEGEKVLWKGETPCIKETLSPKWQHTFEITGVLSKLRGVQFTVQHKDIFALIGEGKFLGMAIVELPQGVQSLPSVVGQNQGARRGSTASDEKFNLVLPLGKGNKKEQVTGSLVITMQHRTAGSKTAFDEMAASQLLSRREELFLLKQQKANHKMAAQTRPL